MKQEKNSQRKFNYIVLSISLLIILVSLLFIFGKEKPLETKTIPLMVEIGDRIGTNTDIQMLNFGGIMPGQKITKKITLSNGFPYDIRIEVLLDNGNITKYIYGENSFILDVQESKEYEINLIVPNDADHGIYEGNLIIEFYK